VSTRIAWSASERGELSTRKVWDKNNNGKADKREGKDVSHNKPLSKGGTNKDGYRIENSSKNRSRNYKKKGPKKK